MHHSCWGYSAPWTSTLQFGDIPYPDSVSSCPLPCVALSVSALIEHTQTHSHCIAQQAAQINKCTRRHSSFIKQGHCSSLLCPKDRPGSFYQLSAWEKRRVTLLCSGLSASDHRQCPVSSSAVCPLSTVSPVWQTRLSLNQSDDILTSRNTSHYGC